MTAHPLTEPVPWTRVDGYVVTYPTNTRSPRIRLSAQSGEFAGELVFISNGTPLPADTDDEVYLHLNDFANVLGLLRDERPVYYVHNGTDPDSANGLQTGGTVGSGRAVRPQDDAIRRCYIGDTLRQICV